MNTLPGATTFPGANAYICGIWDLGQQNIDSQKNLFSIGAHNMIMIFIVILLLYYHIIIII